LQRNADSWEEPAQEALQGAVLFRLGQELRSLPVFPTVGDDRLPMEFVEIDVRIVKIHCVPDPAFLIARQLQFGDPFVIIVGDDDGGISFIWPK
jgi:hypothetical protein